MWSGRWKKTAQRIKPGGTVPEVLELLEADPARSVEGVEDTRLVAPGSFTTRR